ncbi:hypothetical protein AB0919_19345 [Streptomyces sp. NPDC046994]|uniref:hypothetical protein n=1 Tax=Streptomyces sp. NPDC046994 TaxID=3155735 RepID=UPI003453AFF5
MKPTMTRRRLIELAGVTVSAALAVALGARLSSYGVPVLLLVACSTACMTTFVTLLFRVSEALSMTTHRCKRPGCDFQIHLRNANAAESRRWQELAADHPHRGL